MSSPYAEFEGGFEAADDWDDASDDMAYDLSAVGVDALADQKLTGDAAEDSMAELDDIAKGFRARMQTEADRLELVTMSDFYTCVVFPTGRQLRAFLKATGWQRYGSYGGPNYIDGRKIAEAMEIDIGPDPEWPAIRRDATYDSLAMTVEENKAIEI